jgi:hypothetical protein
MLFRRASPTAGACTSTSRCFACATRAGRWRRSCSSRTSSTCDGTLPGGWALDDGVGLLFRGLRMDRLVSSRPGAGAQRVDQVAGELVRGRLTPELLGDGEQATLGGIDEAVQELRRVHRMRRRLGDGRG